MLPFCLCVIENHVVFAVEQKKIANMLRFSRKFFQHQRFYSTENQAPQSSALSHIAKRVY